jgi:quinol-cytochrome oxidoreductase complex cytochrome b subunit
LLALLGVTVATVGYCLPGDVTSRQAMFTIANTLISGAIGAYVGHGIGASSSSKITGDNPVVNQIAPVLPQDEKPHDQI